MNNVKNWLLGTVFLVTATTTLLIVFSPGDSLPSTASTVVSVDRSF